MAGDLEDQIQHLERALGHLRLTSKQAFGFVDKVEYQGVMFDVSRRAVIADLSPLFFSHLIEHIDQDGIGAAVKRLYDRLAPLLVCRHRWTALKRESDEQVRSMARTAAGDVCTPHICKICNAYVLGLQLPVIGRNMG
jgi:hypothetical protein